MLLGPLGPGRHLGIRMASLRREAGPRAGHNCEEYRSPVGRLWLIQDVAGIPEEKEPLRLFGKRRGC